jgi:transposase
VRLLVDHREDLVGERTRIIARLRWHLHELDPGWEPKARSLDRPATWDQVQARLDGVGGTVARLARELVTRCSELTAQIRKLEQETCGHRSSSWTASSCATWTSTKRSER